MAWLLMYKDNPRFRGLVIRKNADDLRDWIDRAEWLYRPTGAKFTGKPVEIEFPSGAKIRTGHLKDENAYQKYQGHEYHRIVIEELTQIPEKKYYQQLVSSCRSTVDIPPRVFCTTNPDGPGFWWVKEHWNIPDWPTETVKTESAEGGRVFIPAKVSDNTQLTTKDPSYQLRLAGIDDENLRKAWLDGYWGEPILQGVIYQDEIKKARLNGRIGKYKWDPRHPVYTYWDIGRDATPILFMQLIGNVWHLIDFYEVSNSNFQHLGEYIRSKPYWYAQHFGPHDLMKTDMTGVNVLQLAQEQGITFTVVPKGDREEGILAVKSKFQRLHIDESCEGFIKRISAYRREWDDDKQVYKDNPVHDWASHAADALRYWAVSPDPMSPGQLDQNFSLYSTSYK